jgi:hypothetical protein
MKKCLSFILVLNLLINVNSYAQDSTSKPYVVAGNFGITNNGISIIPTFSLKQPAFNFTASLSKGGKFSIDPDVRLTFDGRKGGAMLWFRYKMVEGKKFNFRVGAHPAFNLALKTVTEGNKSWNITQARRFVATELAPSYTFNHHFAIGAYYLHGNGLQTDGPISTHFVNFSTSFSGLSIGGNYALNINPQVYYLQVDQQDGFYLTGNVILTNKKSPFAFMYLYNKEIRTNITGSKNLDWNLTLMYNFNKHFKSVK